MSYWPGAHSKRTNTQWSRFDPAVGVVAGAVAHGDEVADVVAGVVDGEGGGDGGGGHQMSP